MALVPLIGGGAPKWQPPPTTLGPPTTPSNSNHHPSRAPPHQHIGADGEQRSQPPSTTPAERPHPNHLQPPPTTSNHPHPHQNVGADGEQQRKRRVGLGHLGEGDAGCEGGGPAGGGGRASVRGSDKQLVSWFGGAFQPHGRLPPPAPPGPLSPSPSPSVPLLPPPGPPAPLLQAAATPQPPPHMHRKMAVPSASSLGTSGSCGGGGSSMHLNLNL